MSLSSECNRHFFSFFVTIFVYIFRQEITIFVVYTGHECEKLEKFNSNFLEYGIRLINNPTRGVKMSVNLKGDW